METASIADIRGDARMLKALSHPTRLRIVDAIRQGKHCVRDLEELLGVSQSNVSQHLTILRNLDLVEPLREGTMVCYKLKSERVEGLVRFLAGSSGGDAPHEESNVKEKQWVT